MASEKQFATHMRENLLAWSTVLKDPDWEGAPSSLPVLLQEVRTRLTDIANAFEHDGLPGMAKQARNLAHRCRPETDQERERREQDEGEDDDLDPLVRIADAVGNEIRLRVEVWTDVYLARFAAQMVE